MTSFQKGFTLIEIMVVMVILSFGLVAVVAATGQAARSTRAIAELESTAAAQDDGAAYDLAGALSEATNAVDLVILASSVLANIDNADLSASTTGSELMKAVVTEGDGNAAASFTVDGAHNFYLATDDGSNGYLYLCENTAGTALIASEITLVATFTGALLGTLEATETVLL